MTQPTVARPSFSAREGPKTAASGTRLINFQPTDGIVCQATRCGSTPSIRPLPDGWVCISFADLREIDRADRR